MKTVIIASENPVKMEVARRSFAAVFPNEEFDFRGTRSASGVPDQPMDGEARQGAQNRLNDIRRRYPDADFLISQEGGLCREGERLFSRAWIAVADRNGSTAESSTAQFYLPDEIARLIREGRELGTATDMFFKTTNSKHDIGAIGYLTDGLVSRTEYYLPAAIIALSELKHREWFS